MHLLPRGPANVDRDQFGFVGRDVLNEQNIGMAMSYYLVAANDGVFVGCIRLGILHRPTRIAILLRELGGLVFPLRR